MKRWCFNCMSMFDDEYGICPSCGWEPNEDVLSSRNLEPGSILNGRYTVGNPIGSGSFGVTYLAWDGSLGRKVAIKEYLPSEFSTRTAGESRLVVLEDEKAEQFAAGKVKFVDEARKLAKFSDEPGIVEVYESFEENDTAYIVMEYLQGETLQAYLDREGMVDEDKAVEMLWPIMKSLERVHQEGILHRDIAPDNIFLIPDNSGELKVKLIDFGAARYATTSHTRSMTTTIKQGYSPEEQYRSRNDQGTYTDVYALAATLYRMMTGRIAPDALKRRMELTKNGRDILVEPHKYNKNISLQRENALLNALNIRIEDRTQTVTEFMNDLQSEKPVKRIYGNIKRLDLYRWPLWLKILMPGVLGLLLIFGILLGTGVISFKSSYSKEVAIPDGWVAVPELVGKNQEEAKDLLNEQGLKGYVSNIVVSEKEESLILSQNPMAPQYLSKGADVGYVVNKNIKAIDLNNLDSLTGLRKESALGVIADLGLGAPNITYGRTDDFSVDMVYAVDKGDKEKIFPGDVITIFVSLGAKTMPNVVSQKRADAEKVLTEKGISYKNGEAMYDEIVPAGVIVTQSIPAGTNLQGGETVILCESLGKKPTVTVPNLLGKQLSEAKSILEKAGLTYDIVEEYSEDKASGMVMEQLPKANNEVKPSSKVTLSVSKGKKPTPTPTNTPTPLPKYNIAYNANGGSGAPSVQVKNYNESIKLSTATPTRDYYTFKGWATSSGGNVVYAAGASYTKNENVTLYAVWGDKPTSDWIEAKNLPSGAKTVSTKTQYRSRNKEYKESTNSSMSGWTQYGTEYKYSEWSSKTYHPGSIPGSSTDTTEYVACTVTGWAYFYCPNCGNHDGHSYCHNCGHSPTEWVEMWSNIGWNDVGFSWYDNSQFTNDIPGGPWKKWDSHGGDGVTGAARTGYSKRTRTRSLMYKYWRWGSWSSWQDNSITANSDREVETRTMVKYINK